VQSSSQIITTDKPTTKIFTGRMPFLSLNNSVIAPKERVPLSTDLLTPSSPGGLPILSLTTKGFRLSSGRVANPCQPSDISNQMTQHNNNNIIYLTFFNLLRPATATAAAAATATATATA